MCTLSFIPKIDEKNGFILTSNRDEAVERQTFPPDFHFFKSKKLLFPKDAVAGGSWIGISEHNRAICLLNGAFEPHRRKESYRKSRGIMVLEFLASENLNELLKGYDFNGIEPFTMVLIDYEEKLNVLELVWDGRKKYFSKLPLQPHIWSSAPLYSDEMKAERKAWFREFLEMKKNSAEDIFNFHLTGGTGDQNKDLVIDRGFLKTKSITQIEKASKKMSMRYQDLETGQNSLIKFRG